MIAAHVTLCREDEITDWQAVEHRAADTSLEPLRLKFGSPVRDGDSVLLPVIEGEREFSALRRLVLSDVSGESKLMNAHVTIIHPRNGRCTDAIFADIQHCLLPFETTLAEVAFIEQRGEGRWKTLASYPMRQT